MSLRDPAAQSPDRGTDVVEVVVGEIPAADDPTTMLWTVRCSLPAHDVLGHFDTRGDAEQVRADHLLVHEAERTRTALGKQGAAVARRRRSGGTTPKTRVELYEEAKRRDIPGRSKMGRTELLRALGRRD